MATVQNLIDLFDIKTGGYQFSFANDPADKIKLLNAAKHKMWLLLVSTGREKGGNWFDKSAALSWASGSRDLTLPTDFHAVKFLEATTASWESVRFLASDWRKDNFQSQRRSATAAAATDNEVYYIVSGDNPATLSLSKNSPSTVALTLWYESIIAEWTVVGDVIDRILTPYQDCLTTYAVVMGVLSRADAAVAQPWLGLWENDKASIAGAAAMRQLANMVELRPFDLA